MTRSGRRLASLAAAAGAAGLVVGGVHVLDTAHGPAADAAPAPAPSSASPVTVPADLDRRVAALLAQDTALREALAQARQRIGSEVSHSRHTLALLQRQVAKARAALLVEQGNVAIVARSAATRAATPAPAPAPVAAPAPAPATHTTTGASGAKATGKPPATHTTTGASGAKAGHGDGGEPGDD